MQATSLAKKCHATTAKTHVTSVKFFFFCFYKIPAATQINETISSMDNKTATTNLLHPLEGLTLSL